MCIAILNNTEQPLTKKTLKNCWVANNDGAGLLYSENGECHRHQDPRREITSKQDKPGITYARALAPASSLSRRKSVCGTFSSRSLAKSNSRLISY